MTWIWKGQQLAWLDLKTQPVNQIIFWLASFGKSDHQGDADAWKPDKEKLQTGRSKEKIENRH